MEKYELLFVLPAKYTEGEFNELAEKVKGIVAAAGGNVAELHNLGKRRLAYPIKTVRNGQYFMAFFEAENAVISKLNEMLRMSSDVLRHLVVLRDPHVTKIPSFIEEEPRRERRERREGEPFFRSREAQPAPVQAPLQPQEKMSMEELDKKLDKILADDII